MSELLSESVLPTERVGKAGIDENECPYALSHSLASRADVVVGDYNYVFDPRMSAGWQTNGWGDWVVVVDEAHNLVERARGYASPRLDARLAHEAEYWLAEQYGSGTSIHASFCNRLAHCIEECWVETDLDQEGEWETDFPTEELHAFFAESQELILHYSLLRGTPLELRGSVSGSFEISTVLHRGA